MSYETFQYVWMNLDTNFVTSITPNNHAMKQPPLLFLMCRNKNSLTQDNTHACWKSNLCFKQRKKEKKKKRRQGVNCRTFSQNPHTRGKSHNHHPNNAYLSVNLNYFGPMGKEYCGPWWLTAVNDGKFKPHWEWLHSVPFHKLCYRYHLHSCFL